LRKLFNFEFFSAEAALKEAEDDPKNTEYRIHAQYLRMALLVSLAGGLEDLVDVLREGRNKATADDRLLFDRAINSLSGGIDEYYEKTAQIARDVGEDNSGWDIVMDVRLNYEMLPKPGLTEEALRAGTYKAEFESEEYLTHYCAESFITQLDETVESVRGYNTNYVSFSGEVDLAKGIYLVAEKCRERARWATALACYGTVIRMGGDNRFDKYGRLAESAISLMRREGHLPPERKDAE
jgi:hypothetical protein